MVVDSSAVLTVPESLVSATVEVLVGIASVVPSEPLEPVPDGSSAAFGEKHAAAPNHVATIPSPNPTLPMSFVCHEGAPGLRATPGFGKMPAKRAS
jgi:hypothetical protein